MKQLLIFRHAKAETIAPLQDDKDRHLAERGRLEAAKMGEDLAGRGLGVDLWLVSSSTRTKQTHHCLTKAMSPGRAVFLDELYNADARTLRRLIDQYEDAHSLALIGHNPGVHQLVMDLLLESAAPESVMASLSLGFKTCQVCLFEIDEFGRFGYVAHYLPSSKSIT
jgi:phosphohistidine phosphatase